MKSLTYERHFLPKITIPKRDIVDAQRAQDSAVCIGESHALPDLHRPAPALPKGTCVVLCRLPGGLRIGSDAALVEGPNYDVPHALLERFKNSTRVNVRRVPASNTYIVETHS
jgi:hypothetical protein